MHMTDFRSVAALSTLLYTVNGGGMKASGAARGRHGGGTCPGQDRRGVIPVLALQLCACSRFRWSPATSEFCSSHAFVCSSLEPLGLPEGVGQDMWTSIRHSGGTLATCVVPP